MNKIIAVSNQKGGVAKTTTCLSLGAALAEIGQSVLLIDLDPQANLTLSMGFQPEKFHRAVGDALLGNVSLLSVSRESTVFELDLVPANPRLALIDKLLYGQKGYEFRLKSRLKTIDNALYDYVLIDCPPSFSALTLNAFTAANLLLIPVQCEYYAAHALKQTTALAKLAQRKTNPGLSYKVLVTMYDRRNKISRVVFEQLQNDLGHLLFDTKIEIDTKLRESPAFSQPITVYAPKTRGAQQYRTLAQELINYG